MIESLISRVVKRARLRRAERRDVERELRSHFASGLDEGKTVESLVNEFGDAHAAGRMIGRAKRRCRGIAWQSFVWARRAVGALFALVVVTYAWAAWAYYRPVCVSSAKYEERMASAMGMTEGQRGDAWKQVRTFVGSISEEWNRQRESLVKEPEWDESDWAAVASLLAQVRPLIDRVIPALEAESFGYTLEDWRTDSERWELDRPGPLVLGSFPPLWELATLNSWVRFDFMFAARTGDVRRAEMLMTASARIGVLVEPMTLAIGQLVQLSIGQQSANWILEETSAHGIERFADLSRVTEALEVMRALSMTYDLDAEQICTEDLLAHLYGGDKPGNHVGGQGWRETYGDAIFGSPSEKDPWWEPRNVMMTPIAPIASMVMPTFGESIAKVRESYANTHRYINTPMWEDFQGDAGEMGVGENSDPWESFRQYPYAANYPILTGGRRQRGSALLYIDAARTAIAIESYRRDRGEYPSNLEALVPSYMPRMPIDQATGKPLTYRITEEGPVVYSLGIDRDDDGGTPVYDDKGKVMRPGGLIDPGQWAGYDAEHQTQYDGDYVFWPVCACPELPAKFPPANF